VADKYTSGSARTAFEHYYQTELGYLRDVGQAFAEKHPALAGMLAERGGDPDVERLLEGFAFVAARLHQRIDNSVPELVEALTELLLPHFLRPTPASTIVEFRPSMELLRGEQHMPRGTRILSRPVRGTPCRFRTTTDLALRPLSLVSQQLDDASLTRPALTLRFSCPPGAGLATMSAAPLRLHLHGERASTTQLYLWFARHLASVAVRVPDGHSVELGNQAVRPAGFSPSEALVPWPSFSAHGPRLLLEYFALPSKFLFLDVSGLERARHLETDDFDLVFRFNRPPPLPARLAGDTVRLHCVPAVNLFEASAEPIRVGPESRATLLRAAGIEPLHAEVFSVESVTGVSTSRARTVQYEPFHSFSHAATPQGHEPFYKLLREPSPVDEGMHTYIRLDRGPEGQPLPEEQTLSIDIEATNRSLPGELQTGDVCVPTSDVPAGLTFSNIDLVSRPARPPLGSELSWRFVAHLSSTRRSLADLESLKTLLSLYCLHAGTDTPAARANQLRIEAIGRISHEPVTRVVKGAAVLGTLYQLEVEQERFESEGDAFLFGSVLHRVLMLNERLNSFADLSLTLLPSRLAYRWHAEILR
jgi:type VI secretion system protein ImpG